MWPGAAPGNDAEPLGMTPVVLIFWISLSIWNFGQSREFEPWGPLQMTLLCWRLARRSMCLLATGYTNCLRHTVLLSMSKPLKLKTVQGIWNILPHSKVEKCTTNMIWEGRLIKRQNKSSRWNKIINDFLSYPVDVNHTFGLKERLEIFLGFQSEIFMYDNTLTKVQGGVDFHLYLEAGYTLQRINLGNLCIWVTF